MISASTDLYDVQVTTSAWISSHSAAVLIVPAGGAIPAVIPGGMEPETRKPIITEKHRF